MSHTPRTSQQRSRRQSSWTGKRLAATCGLALLPTIARAHFVGKPVDTTLNFSMAATHAGDLTADASLSLLWGFNWPTDGLVVEDAGLDWDTLTIRGTAWHQNAPPGPPHGEPPNTASFPFDFFVDGSVEDAGIGFGDFAVRMAPPQGAAIGHVRHQDLYVANLSFIVEWDEDLLSYNFALSGRHTEDGESWTCVSSTLISSPECDRRDYASVTAIVEQSGRLDLNASVIGVQPPEVTQIVIRLGPPGGGGPILMPLPFSSILPAPHGLLVETSDMPVPQHLAQMMASGQTSLEIMTVQCPAGAMGGMLAPVQLSAPCPGDLNGDGRVDLIDLTELLSAFGVNGGGDLDGDGDTDLTDLTRLLANFGVVC